MTKVFLSVVNMSIAASWIVLAVLLLRFLLKKAPKWLSVLLWAVVALRLICPFTIESTLSLIPSAQTLSPAIMTDTYPQIHTGIPVFNNSINPIIGETFSPNPGDSINPLQVWIPLATVLWGVGIFALLVYGSVSYFRLKKKVNTAVLLQRWCIRIPRSLHRCQGRWLHSPAVPRCKLRGRCILRLHQPSRCRCNAWLRYAPDHFRNRVPHRRHL